MTAITQDLKQFEGDISLVPYAQIINPDTDRDNSVFGVAVKKSEAKAALFKPNEDWHEIENYFDEEDEDGTIFINRTPRILFLNSSDLLITKDGVVKPFNKSTWAKDKEDGWRTLRYAVIYFIDPEQNLLSKDPFRIKLIGSAGYDLFQSYHSAKNRNCFCKKLLSAFTQLSPNSKGVNRYFFTHGIFAPTFGTKTIEVSDNNDANNKEVEILTVSSFEIPDGSTKENFLKNFIDGKSKTSSQIKTATEFSQSWVDSKKLCTK